MSRLARKRRTVARLGEFPLKVGERSYRLGTVTKFEMITVPTTLVLGAGASAHLLYPTADQLRTKIVQWLAPGFLDHITGAGLDYDEYKEFATDFCRSGNVSIDAFLELRESDWGAFGKKVIALMLAPVECTERPFFHIHTPSQGTGANRVRFGNWYETLANALEAPCGKYHENNLSVITFNYDRSLEYYLTETRSRRYKISFADAWKEVGALTIAHIHGHLGPLVGDGARPYGRYPTADEIKKCAEGIHIVHEAGDEHPVNQAHSLLTLSERVIFIGFGYDDRNLKKLKWANLGSVNLQSSIVPTIGVKARASKLAEGSWCGMTPNSRLSVESQFGIALPAYGDNVANEFIHHLQPLQNSKDQLSQVMAQKRQ